MNCPAVSRASFCISRGESDRLARRNDAVRKSEDGRLRSGEEERCSPDSFAVRAFTASG